MTENRMTARRLCLPSGEIEIDAKPPHGAGLSGLAHDRQAALLLRITGPAVIRYGDVITRSPAYLKIEEPCRCGAPSPLRGNAPNATPQQQGQEAAEAAMPIAAGDMN
jgi:hypothetical protein